MSDEDAPRLGYADWLEEQGSGASVKEFAARWMPASRGRFSQRSSGTSPSIRLRSHRPAAGHFRFDRVIFTDSGSGLPRWSVPSARSTSIFVKVRT